MFRKKSKEKIKKMDVLITSVVLGTIVAGAFGIRKSRQKHLEQNKESIKKKSSFFVRIFKKFLGK